MDRVARLRASCFGAHIQRARVELGFTQERLAAEVVKAGAHEGVELTLTSSAVSRWESGRFEPALRYRRYLALVLGIDSRTLFPIELVVPRRRDTARRARETSETRNEPDGREAFEVHGAPRPGATPIRDTVDEHGRRTLTEEP